MAAVFHREYRAGVPGYLAGDLRLLWIPTIHGARVAALVLCHPCYCAPALCGCGAGYRGAFEGVEEGHYPGDCLFDLWHGECGVWVAGLGGFEFGSWLCSYLSGGDGRGSFDRYGDLDYYAEIPSEGGWECVQK